MEVQWKGCEAKEFDIHNVCPKLGRYAVKILLEYNPY